MGIFKRKLDNAAAVAIPRPPVSTTVHNHSTPWPAIIFAGFVCLLASLPVLWFILVFLFDQMGSREPGREAAFWVVIIPVLLFAGWLLKWLLMAWLSESHSFKLEMAREITRREELRLLHAQTTLEPGRYTEADYQFARVVVSVMEVAYNRLEKNGWARFPGRARPWSRTEVLETAEKIGVTITHTQALQVAKDLAADGIITAADMGQIAKDYPNLSSVRAHLDNKYGRPIVSVSPVLRSNAGYVPIKN